MLTNVINMETQSYFGEIVVAGIGGLVVVIGLLMEHFGDRDWYEYKHLPEVRSKSVRYIGEWLVIIGVLVEVVVACKTANDEWLSKRASRLKAEQLEKQINATSNNVVKVDEKIKPREISDEKRAYASVFLGKYKGTPFVRESYADPDSIRFGEKLSELLITNGWIMAGSVTGGRIEKQMPNDPFPKIVEPVGVEIEVNQPELLKAGSALDTFLNGCQFQSKLIFNPHPAMTYGGQGVHVRIGTQK